MRKLLGAPLEVLAMLGWIVVQLLFFFLPSSVSAAFLLVDPPKQCHHHPPSRSVETSRFPNVLRATDSSAIDIEFQSDSDYGRGDQHLSASLEEGDVVLYQTGSWFVDGVEVGDGSPPRRCLAVVGTIQLVWTHNCEHGVIRGFSLEVTESGDERQLRLIPSSQTNNDMIEFGPEQLIAKLPLRMEMIDGSSFVEVPADLRQRLLEELNESSSSQS